MFTIVHGKHIEFNEWMSVYILPDQNPRPGYTVDQCMSIPVPECMVILWTYSFTFTDVTCLECAQYAHHELKHILHCTL